MTDTLKDYVINGIIQREGGYVNDVLDSGGETNFGITKQVARLNGYFGEIENLPRDKAYDIYVHKYWDKLMLDDISKISPKVAEEMADTGVNMGTHRATTFLQRSLNALNDRGHHYRDLSVDGVVGNNTITAFGDFIARRGEQGELVLFNMLNSLQGAFYIELAERREKEERFIFGWFKNRVV